MKKAPSIKILVGYHKPAVLLKDDILTPIHLGRALATEASKDGAMSQKDYQWMLDNMIGDDTGDNISKENRKYCELTALYWAWKNYDKLGNPDYIGFIHYRRHLAFKPLENIENGVCTKEKCDESYFENIGLNNSLIKETVKNYDIIHAQKINHIKNVKEQFDELTFPPYCLNKEVFSKTLLNICKLYPEMKEAVDSYLQSKEHFWYNCFIMKKEIFFEYMSFVCNIIFTTAKNTDLNRETINGQRVFAYILERLTGIFISSQLKKNKKVAYLPLVYIENTNLPSQVMPFFNKNNIPIIVSADNNYAPYLDVFLKSLLVNAAKEYNYDIIVLDGGICEKNKKLIKRLEENNVKIRFVEMAAYIRDIENIFTIHHHFSIATYYRFFIPEIMKNYKKVLYLDCDMIVLQDIAKLFNVSLDKKAVGAVRDVEMIRAAAMDGFYQSNWCSYVIDILKLDNVEDYFQAGVLLLDIEQLIKLHFTRLCLDFLKEIKTPIYVDQCILNHVLKKRVKYLDFSWNVEWHIPQFINPQEQLPAEIFLKYKHSLECPGILHYCGEIKPWRSPEKYQAHYFWHYARMTPFYEEILFKNQNCQSCNTNNAIKAIDLTIVRETANYLKNKIRYWRYRLLSKITFGKKRRKYKQKRKELKARLKQVRAFLKGK